LGNKVVIGGTPANPIILRFNETNVDGYSNEVLGGFHTSTARRQLHQQYLDVILSQHILAEVCIGLIDDEPCDSLAGTTPMAILFIK
jgi:hypothetical protein